MTEVARTGRLARRPKQHIPDMKKFADLKVFISSREATCDECGEDLGRKAWITLDMERKALCLTCSDLDHLLFLPAGDAALTRRSRKYSTLSPVVLKWSRARKRYERQGVLVEKQALERAEQECMADSEVRARRQERAVIRRTQLDSEYVERFAQRVREFFPGCPEGRETMIAEHACLKYSGRIGRTAFAKKLDGEAVRLAVIAHIRHAETEYDQLLVTGCERGDARTAVKRDVNRVLADWGVAA